MDRLPTEREVQFQEAKAAVLDWFRAEIKRGPVPSVELKQIVTLIRYVAAMKRDQTDPRIEGLRREVFESSEPRGRGRPKDHRHAGTRFLTRYIYLALRDAGHKEVSLQKADSPLVRIVERALLFIEGSAPGVDGVDGPC
jgi:hypothetical protein